MMETKECCNHCGKTCSKDTVRVVSNGVESFYCRGPCFAEAGKKTTNQKTTRKEGI